LSRAAVTLRAVSVVASLVAAGCAASASPESGVTALLRVSNAQFVEGALPPDTASTGTAVISGVAINNTNVYPGEENFPLAGTVTGATALVGLEDDVGYWIVPATLIDQTTAGGYDFSAQLTFSPLMPVGSQTLILRGVTADGTIGPAQLYKLEAATTVPTGPLVITLQWDTEADLDLHVVMPNVADPTTPIEIWSKHPVGLPVPVLGGPPIYPDQIANAPYLDFDSNANCVIDGRRQENVIFPVAPPPGDYTVLVDTPSLCGQADAQWTVSATLMDGTSLGFVQWESTDASTRGAHVAGSGLLAFKFSIE
jgi:hypothetical protein